MAYNESDDKLELQNEIRRLENELAGLGGDIYEIAMRRKFLRHRIADLEYELKHPDE
jgi:septal ring factor EnvC (AmiA/AmiB activator)